MSTIERERQVTEVLTERERRARTLEAAALEIEVRGWARFSSCNARGEVCGGGALLFALGAPPCESHFTDADMAALNAVWGWRGESLDSAEVCNKDMLQIAPFNDNVAESAADVTFLLRWRAQELRDGLA